MKSIATFVVALLSLFACSNAFAPRPVALSKATKVAFPTERAGFLGDKEREALTRETEPEEFFRTNTDKMTDAEKLPIAIAGIAFISLPFIAGLIALYSAK